ncbi:MAG: UDP-2,4-diacetamido-2,4,6-trideoxy-beta-L-altropyranose hydrolase [Eubacteriales bacterium]
MKVFFRADASVQIGTGHIMRCLTLADELHVKDVDISFICRELPGNLCNLIDKSGYKVFRLPYEKSFLNNYASHIKDTHWDRVRQDIDAEQTCSLLARERGNIEWLIVDHYSLGQDWERHMRPFVNKIMVIDDLADRVHDCDLILDQNFYTDMETRYEGLVPSNCQKLLGPKHMLLRPEFIEARESLRKRDGRVNRILVFFGGSDWTNETVKALKSIRQLNKPEITVDVVVGEINPYKEQVKQLCSLTPNTNFYCQVGNMAQLIANSDLAIGAGGVAIWERCFLGIPSITLVVAQNQLETAAAVAAIEATWNLGVSANVSVEDLVRIINKALNKPEALIEMSDKAFNLMGWSDRITEKPVLQAILGVNNNKS